MSMKLNLKYLAFMTLLLGSSSAFAQLTVQDNCNARTNGMNDGQEALTYTFPVTSSFKLMNDKKEIIQKGLGDSADLGVLAPGMYFMIYERTDGKAMIDRFEVKK
ncbi:MAG: hypothetical protein DCO96_10205 [Fluviicola sp. XM-24bin1]|nr:MAG: hypothetical protein DCO96_10205 [Fluviicola sp. XM-24bin1]